MLRLSAFELRNQVSLWLGYILWTILNSSYIFNNRFKFITQVNTKRTWKAISELGKAMETIYTNVFFFNFHVCHLEEFTILTYNQDLGLAYLEVLRSLVTSKCLSFPLQWKIYKFPCCKCYSNFRNVCVCQTQYQVFSMNFTHGNIDAFSGRMSLSSLSPSKIFW